MEIMCNTIPDHPIFALATPYVKGPIAVIRVSGNKSLLLLQPMLSDLKWNVLSAHKATYCKLYNPKTGEIIDECIITVFKKPHSYTGEDLAELSIHGSIAGIERVCACLRMMGFADAEPGEFTKRAFLHGKMDLTQAEAVHAIIQSRSLHEHMHAVHQISGALSEKINALKNTIAHLAARCSISLDYPDDEIQESTVISADEIDAILHSLKTLVSGYDFRQLQRKGVRVVLGGRTNAGKSSLFNALLKEERAIVSEIHGTTRDYLECMLELQGIPIQFFDTAGLRENADVIEKIGIEKSHALFSSAHAVLYVVDATIGWIEEDTRVFQSIQKYIEGLEEQRSFLIVWNKIDSKDDDTYLQSVPDDIAQLTQSVSVSATKYLNIAQLQNKLFRAITQCVMVPENNDVIISSERQKQHIEACMSALYHVRNALAEGNIPLDMISLDVDVALKELGAITGEVTTEDVLDIMFREFCVGK